MNYTEWANDYLKTVDMLNDRIASLQKRKRHTNDLIAKLNIDHNINHFIYYRNECMRIANELFKRAEKNKEQDV